MKRLISARWTHSIAILLVTILACVSMGRIIYRAWSDHQFDNDRWGMDLYQFWYAGHFLIQGRDPYTEIQKNTFPDIAEPAYPSYLLGDQANPDTATLIRKWSHVSIVPGTAPLMLILTPLSFLPWVAVTLIWLIANLLFAVGCMRLAIRIGKGPFTTRESILIYALFFSLIAIRQVIELGQTSLFVTLTMLLSLHLVEKRPYLAGILLGIALSKYTLAIPIAIYFVCTSRWKAVITAGVVQIIAMLAIAILAHTNPMLILKAYFDMSVRVGQQTSSYAIHVLALGWGTAGKVVAILLALWISIVVVRWFVSHSKTQRRNPLEGVLVILLMLAGSLAVLYHGRHDMVSLATVMVAVYALMTHEPELVHLESAWQRIGVFGVLGFILLLWIAPVYWITGTDVYRQLNFATIVIVIAAASWMLTRKRIVRSPECYEQLP